MVLRDYAARITAINYKNGKRIGQKTSTNPLDFDPSEYFDWNWEVTKYIIAKN